MSSNSPNNSYDFWSRRRSTISSSKGGWIKGKDVYSHGYSIMNDLMGKVTYMQMVILNVTGRLVEKRLADWFEANFIGFSWPDPRIWCNQVGALAGAGKATVVAATVSGVLAADSRIYGGSQTSIEGMNFIKKALSQYRDGQTVGEIVSQCPKRDGRPLVMGYVRPVNGRDERIAPIEKVTKELGFEIGEHLSLAYKLSEYLDQNYNEGMNIAGYACAFMADQGISSEELYQIRALAVASGVTACFLDTYNKTRDSFLPLRCDDIDYQGLEAREIS